jgi:radical SAM protein with 4Fe4S-binding SPASM domain
MPERSSPPVASAERKDLPPPAGKPRIVGWEITNQCNLSCIHCFTASGKRPHDEMDTGECRRVIDSMAVLGVGTIGWTGGEPLLREDLEELAGYARDRGIASNITTNAVLLDERRAQGLLDAGMRAVQISLDGSTPERNRRIRGSSDEEFHQILRAIRLCKSLNLRVHLATLISLETLEDARGMVALGKREGVDAIRFCGFAPVGRGKSSRIRSRLELSQSLGELGAFIREMQDDNEIVMTFDVSFGPVPPDFAFHTCTAGVETFYLKGNGDVYPCTALIDPRFRVGNVREKSLEEIWAMPEMRAHALLPREEIQGACRTCDNFAYCRGACRGATLAHTGDLLASFPLCLYKLEPGQATAPDPR